MHDPILRPAVVLMALLTSLGARAELSLDDAWVRALPPTQRNTAAYVTLRNEGDTPVEIVGGRADLAGRVEVHRSEEVDGLMRMVPVPSLPVAPGETVRLAPGGLHLMLLDLERMPAEGETLQLCLTPAAGSPVCATAAVRRRAGGGEHAHHH
ncbi:copper chaperone PCu(A)C [Parahaliea mediterranea]|uniref:Copper chaperone PCu(A)C n=1 Tax=Parahaliea mediterranea TaxID=651086 RepID=A0A939DJ77_9GAMM|nr:copper chaperone PCu(A)C [Parahaliea mediterranea]MBN7799104.1 copper chaperone PCu(A)C [Parahaliea mediterranea]